MYEIFWTLVRPYTVWVSREAEIDCVIYMGSVALNKGVVDSNLFNNHESALIGKFHWIGSH